MDVKPPRLVLIAALPSFVVLLLVLAMEAASPYLIGLVFLVFGVVILFCYLTIASGMERPLRMVVYLLEALKHGDYHPRANSQDEDSFAEIVELLNELSEVFSQRQVLGREQELLLEKIINQIDVAVIALDHQGCCTLANPAAERLIQRPTQDLLGTRLEGLGLQALDLSAGKKQLVALKLPGGSGNVYVHAQDFIEAGERRKLIFITDVERLLHEEERKAWQSLLRVLSHEINNSLTPIASISDTLSRMVRKQSSELEAPLLEGLSVIGERAQSLTVFIEGYRQLARLPEPRKMMVALGAMIARLTPLFPEREFHWDRGRAPSIHVDEEQMEQLFLNLFKNADEAMEPTGAIYIRWEQVHDLTKIYVEDEGTGVSNSENLFVPFYTTKEGGSGIGLALCRQIAFNHDGHIHLGNRENASGATVCLSLPSAHNDSSQGRSQEN